VTPNRTVRTKKTDRDDRRVFFSYDNNKKKRKEEIYSTTCSIIDFITRTNIIIINRESIGINEASHSLKGTRIVFKKIGKYL